MNSISNKRKKTVGTKKQLRWNNVFASSRKILHSKIYYYWYSNTGIIVLVFCSKHQTGSRCILRFSHKLPVWFRQVVAFLCYYFQFCTMGKIFPLFREWDFLLFCFWETMLCCHFKTKRSLPSWHFRSHCSFSLWVTVSCPCACFRNWQNLTL